MEATSNPLSGLKSIRLLSSRNVATRDDVTFLARRCSMHGHAGPLLRCFRYRISGTRLSVMHPRRVSTL